MCPRAAGTGLCTPGGVWARLRVHAASMSSCEALLRKRGRGVSTGSIAGTCGNRLVHAFGSKPPSAVLASVSSKSKAAICADGAGERCDHTRSEPPMTLHPGGTSTPRRVVHTSRSRSLRSAVLACSSSSLSLSSITSNGGRLLELAPPARAVGATSLEGWAGWPYWPVARTKVERELWNMLFCAQCVLVVAPPQPTARKLPGPPASRWHFADARVI